MDLRTDVKSRWRDQHHSSKAAWLQSRWQEVSERERRAQLHNRKLLQDFQRAQDTLTDLVARTEAMNTIRVEYEKYLEQNFPQWQQKLKDKRLSEQRKRIEEHLKACIEQMEEDQGISGGKTSPITTNSPSSVSPDSSHPPISHPIPHTTQRKEKRGEVHVRKPRSSLSKQNNNQNLGIVPNISQTLYIPFSWTSETQPQRSNISKQTKTFQNTHQALNSPVSSSGDPRYGPYPVIQQQHPSSGQYTQHLKPCTEGVQCAPTGAPWTGVPVNPLVWEMLRMSETEIGAERMRYSEEEQEEKWRKDSNSEPENHQTQRQRRKLKGSDRSSELDFKSAHLSDNCGDSGESRARSSEAVNIHSSGTQRTRNQRRKETWTQHMSSSGEKGMVHQGSFLMSDGHSDTNKERDKIIQSSPARRTSVKIGSKASKAQMKNLSGLESHKHLDEEREQEGNGIEHLSADSPTAVEQKKEKKKKTKKGMRKNEDESAEVKYLTDQEEQMSKDGEESKGGEEEEGADVGDEEHGKEVESEVLCGKRRNGERGSEGGSLSEKEVETEGERESVNGGEEEEDDGGEEVEEEEDGDIEDKDGGEEDEEQEDGSAEICVEVRSPRRQMKGSDESNDEANDSEATASDSRRNVHDSLKELYKDEDTEDEELYDQEIEDDIEDDDEDDDDDVVVEKAYPWTRDPAYNHAKYQADEDDDAVEGLLAPQINVQQHQSDEEEEILNSKDSQSDSEEDDAHRKPVSAPVKDKPKDEAAGSDDEFDHFYD